MRLWVKLTLWMAALAVVPALLTGGLALRAANDAARLRPEEALVRQTSTVATVVAGWLDGQTRAMHGWNRVWNVESFDTSLQIGLLRAVYTALDPVVTVALIDAAGEPLVAPEYRDTEAVAPGRVAGSPARAEALVKMAPRQLDAEGTGVSLPYRPPGAAAPVVAVAVQESTSSVRLVAEVSLAALESAFPQGNGLWVSLVASDFERLAGREHPAVAAGTLQTFSNVINDFTFEVPASDGHPALRGAVSAVPGTSWRVLALEPLVVSERASLQIRTQTLLVGVVVLIIVTALGSLLERMITMPLGQLRDVASKLAEGDYSQEITTDRDDELGELVHAFRDMAVRLQANQQRIVRQRDEILSQKTEIDRFNAELQARVEARTRDLRDAQKQLIETSQMRAIAEIGAGLAHELNNPLTSILGVAQLMIATDKAHPKFLKQIEAEAQRCREVVETMVRFSEGEVDLRRARVVDLVPVTGEITASMVASYHQRGVTLLYAPPAGPVAAFVDPTVVRQLLTRLLDGLRAGLLDGSTMEIDIEAADGGAAITFTPDVAFAMGDTADDWRASSVQTWAARRLIELSGGHLELPDGSSLGWRVWLPGA